MPETDDTERIPNQETLEAIEDVNQKRGLSGPYRTTEELWAALEN